MADNFGLSFSPTALDETKQRNGDQAGAVTPVQDAIRTLSLRVPQFRGAAPINPTLLNAPGSQGLPPMAMGGGAMPGSPSAPNLGLEDFLRRLFGMAGSPAMGSAPSSIPAPRTIPGAGDAGPGDPDLVGSGLGGIDFNKQSMQPPPAAAPSKFEPENRFPESFGSY